LHLIASLNPRDSWHTAAIEAEDRLGEAVLRATTQDVFCEVFAAVARYPYLRRSAVETLRAMEDDPLVTLIPQSASLFYQGVSLYKTRSNKGYSLVDCISMVVMREEGITEILTYDHHFEQEGFVALLRKLP
jgi:predicted nucleic acid-binding protein